MSEAIKRLTQMMGHTLNAFSEGLTRDEIAISLSGLIIAQHVLNPFTILIRLSPKETRS